MAYLLLLMNVLLLVSGQLLWKVSVASIKGWNSTTILYLFKSPFFIGGGLLYVIATLIWMYVISKIPFSIAYPFQSLSYVLGMLAAFFIFKEQVSPTQWSGLMIILLGVYLIAK